ncbi:MAG: O-antigen ligase family protein, partial [Deltaproteobacteria bacterium]|nr:O-antigen ligase family protein [Deltaproteobacteria bacterium]
FVALLFARARASWLGLFIALPVLLISIKMVYRFSVLEYIKLKPKRFFGFIAIAVSIIAILWIAMPKRFYPEMKRRLNISTFTQRIQFFHASLELLKENPVFGTGLWSYRNCVYRAQAKIIEADPNYFKTAERPNKPKRVHNEYLEALNDGGLLAAAILLVFFLTIMGHGLKVIHDQETDPQTRIIASTAFSALVAIMVDAFFFFPFRINTTLFLTALTLGLLEGIYLSRYKLISKTQGKEFPFSSVLSCLVILMLVSVLWFRGYKPLKAEMEHFEFKKAIFQKNIKKGETHILNAISYDPGNTRYHIYAGMMYINNFRNYPKAGELIEESLVNFIGDNTLWGVYYTKGLVKFQTGSLFEAREAFQQSLYYNPKYAPSLQKLDELDKIFEKHDKICIKLK